MSCTVQPIVEIAPQIMRNQTTKCAITEIYISCVISLSAVCKLRQQQRVTAQSLHMVFIEA